MSQRTTYPSLHDTSVFITGGATGIGAAIVKQFCQQGARVGFIDLDQESGDTLCSEIAAESGITCWFKKVDVTDSQALKASIFEAGETLGPIRTLVNNAANDNRHSPDELSPEAWRDCMAVNLDASFFATQAVVPGMKAGGSIINLSSINALLGPANMPGYVTAKAGLLGMTKALAKDYGERNIRVNAILPGWVVTDRQLETWLTPEAEQEWSKHVALKDRILPEDVARLALFLAADDSKMITGQSIVVDAGRT